jgi:hypothetical protein
VTKQPSARSVVDCDAPEIAAVNIRNSVMLRKALVDKCVICVQNIENIAIFSNNALEQKLGLSLECLPQVIVKIREHEEIRIPIPQLT